MFQKKKVSPIERRLKDLQKEMSRVNQDLQSAARAKPVEVKPPPFAASPDQAAELPADLKAGGLDPTAGDLFDYAAKAPPAAAVKTAELFPGMASKGAPAPKPAAPPADPGSRSGREKFAHYFMAGHFQNLRPLRQESRVVRNKAILMTIMFLVLLAWVIYYLRTH